MEEKQENKMLSAIVIDDESGAIVVLTRLLDRIGGVRVLATEQNPNLGLRHIMVFQPDIVFLDIQMEKKNGIALLKEIKELSVDSYIVIVSGYDDYTFEAFKNGAFDYLIKPIGIEELERVVFRIHSELEEKVKFEALHLSTTIPKVEQLVAKEALPVKIRTSNKQGYLLAQDILYLKASGSYTEIFLNTGQKEVCTRGLWLLERELPDHFFRIHRSVVVNVHYVTSLQADAQLCLVSQGDSIHELTISKANIDALADHLCLK